jgi:hypothetical protein
MGLLGDRDRFHRVRFAAENRHKRSKNKCQLRLIEDIGPASDERSNARQYDANLRELARLGIHID